MMNKNLGRGWILAGLLASTAATAGLARAGPARGGQAMHGSPGTLGHMMSADPAAMDAHFDKMLNEMLPDSTPEQRTRLKALARTVHADLAGVHAQFRQIHERAHAMLLGPAVDRAGLEALRVEQVHLIDVVSRRLVGGLADMAEVLTPEQRLRLTAHAKNR